MNRKMMRRVLKNGPDNNSSEELELSALLIENGLAAGKFLSNYRYPDSPPASLIWPGQRLED